MVYIGELCVILASLLFSGVDSFLTVTTTLAPHHYAWAHWGSWSTCHVDCLRVDTHTYTQSRTRLCKDHGVTTVSYSHCPGGTSRHTATRNCAIDCPSWSTWSTWSDCSTSCGGGTTIRVRHCGQGETNCPGQAFETNTCGTNGCPVDGKWSAWLAWSSCTHTCGSDAVRSRTRSCDSPAPQYGGSSCSGPAYEVEPCNVTACVIDGGWIDWSTWTTCDVTCGNGSQTRIRTCTNPAPRNGGKLCTGSSVDVLDCVEGGCPVDGGWTDFTTRDCSVTCGNGVTVKYRSCTNPAPAFGGADCVGSATEFSVCSTPACVIDGGWTDWSNWTECSVVCGTAHVWRERSCTNPSPAHGGADCSGHALESQDCYNGLCPTDIKSCYDPDIDQLAKSTRFVLADPDAIPAVCQTSDALQAQMLIQKHCKVASAEIDWELGIQIRDNCDKIPLYAPIGLIDRQTKQRKYGILLDCFKDNIQIADLSCSNSLEVQTFKLNHLATDYHIMLI